MDQFLFIIFEIAMELNNKNAEWIMITFAVGVEEE